MQRRCKYCGRYMEEEADYEFCSVMCASMLYHRMQAGRMRKTCEECGEILGSNGERWGNVCAKCKYKKNYQAQPNQKHTAAPGNGIDEIIAEQQRILRETGKRISYGESMARKQRGDK